MAVPKLATKQSTIFHKLPYLKKKKKKTTTVGSVHFSATCTLLKFVNGLEATKEGQHH
jgi:hypothetical protein